LIWVLSIAYAMEGPGIDLAAASGQLVLGPEFSCFPCIVSRGVYRTLYSKGSCENLWWRYSQHSWAPLLGMVSYDAGRKADTGFAHCYGPSR